LYGVFAEFICAESICFESIGSLISRHREQPIGTNVHWESGALTHRDDDPNLVEAYALFFEAYGYAIQPAADGVDALAAYCVSH
jgi:hypothetical protein